MSRIMSIMFTAPEELVGSILADLGGRVQSVDYKVVELRDGRSRRMAKGPLRRRKTKKSANGDGTKRIMKTLRLAKAPISISELARRSGVAQSSTAYLVKRLSKEIRRTPDGKVKAA